MKRAVLLAGLLLTMGATLRSHDPSAAPITWNREVSRIVYDRCASCHHAGGTSFSLMTYQDAQPHAAAIKDAVLARRMPPWGAVKGFGKFRNDQGLTQQQIDLITYWVEGGIVKGNNPQALPKAPTFAPPAAFRIPSATTAVSGDVTLHQAMRVDGLFPERVPRGASLQIAATLPGGHIEPLLWLYEYRDSYRHPFLFRKPMDLPAGTVIHGVPPDAQVLLIPAPRTAKE